MRPNIKSRPIGAEYGLTTEKSASDIYELSCVVGLRVTLITRPRGSLEHLWVEYYFPRPIGFRLLDESDMLEWWKNKELCSDHHAYEIIEDGWLSSNEFDFSITSSNEHVKEWLITTSNRCVSVVASEPPIIRELLKR